MKNLTATLLCDFYKISHKALYDQDTEVIYSTWTARNSRLKNVNHTVIFGYQGFIKKYLIDYFNENFFNRQLEDVVKEYTRVLKYCLGESNPDVKHIVELHNLGYLPLKITAIPEGTLVPIRVPSLTIENTDTRFFWLTNFIETLFSCEVWQATTSATLAYEYRKLLDKWAYKTCDDNSHVDFQAHDFSMRGMSSLETSMLSGAGHLLSFKGTDTIPAISYLENYYNADIEKELVGCSVPATEHSIMCCNSANTSDSNELREYKAFKRIIKEVHPKGIVSIVSDTWNLWDVLTKTIPALKDEIMNRDGKVVIRPDSGNPVDIICGTFQDTGEGFTLDTSKYGYEKQKGVIQLLWDTFGGTINSKGYKVLDSHIGAIYGDAITLERADEICKRLEAKGFASSNIIFGVGSYTYQMNTRDTFGHALKSTYAIKSSQEVFLYKDPITDDGVKKSQKGKVGVIDEGDGTLKYIDEMYQTDYDHQFANLLKMVFMNGELFIDDSLNNIRERLLNAD